MAKRTFANLRRGVAVAVMLTVFGLAGECRATVYEKVFDLAIPGQDPEAQFGRGAMKTAELFIPDHLHIAGVEAYISLEHGSLADLEISLTSPAGTRIILMRSGNVGLIDTTGEITLGFSENAARPIDSTTQLSAGEQIFRPAAGYSMAAFEGQDSIGTWKIDIADLIYYNTGTLDSVRLAINNPEPGSIALILAGSLFIRRLRAA